MTGIERHWQEEEAAERERKVAQLCKLRDSIAPTLLAINHLETELYPQPQYGYQQAAFAQAAIGTPGQLLNYTPSTFLASLLGGGARPGDLL